MNAQLCDRILDAADEVFRAAGAADFETGIQTVCTMFERLLQVAERLKSREAVRTMLTELPDVPRDQEELVVSAVRMVPAFLRAEVIPNVNTALKDLPRLPGGRRPSLTPEASVQLCSFIAELYGKGVRLKACKQRAAQRFGIGLRTVERVWSQRGCHAGLQDGARIDPRCSRLRGRLEQNETRFVLISEHKIGSRPAGTGRLFLRRESRTDPPSAEILSS